MLNWLKSKNNKKETISKSFKKPVYINKELLKSASTKSEDGMLNFSDKKVDIQKVIDKDLDVVRNRSVNAYYNLPLATSVINTFMKYETPLTFQSKVNYQKLNINPLEAMDLNNEIEDLFDEYSEEIDFMGECNFDELQEMIKLNFLLYGEVFILRRISDIEGVKFRTKYQIIASDQIFTPKELKENSNIINGIEYKMGVPSFIYILKYPPNPSFYKSYPKEDFYRIPYHDSKGMKNVFHIYKKQLPRQNRGFPILTPILKTLNDIDGYNDSEWIKKRIIANIPYFYTSANPDKTSLDMAMQVENEEGDYENITVKDYTISPGETVVGNHGDDLKIVDSDMQDSQYNNFINFNVNQVASALSIAPFLISGDYSNINYSSARAGLIATKNVFKNNIKHDIKKFYKYVAKYFIIECIENNYLKNYDLNKLEYNFVAPKLELMDPAKEMSGIKDKLDYKLISKSEVMKEMGYDFDEIMETIKMEEEKMKELNIYNEIENPINNQDK